MLRNPRIVIIGAGAAGIAAACRLYQSGLKNITILEANNRIGGRIFSTEFGDNVVDLGAQWVHGETDNAVYNLVKSLNLVKSSYKLNDTTKHVFVDATGEILPESESSEVWNFSYSINEHEQEEWKNYRGSYGDFFIEKFHEYYQANPFTNETRAGQILEWLKKFDNSIHCCDTLFDVSVKRLVEYKHCDGDPLLNWKDKGYRTILDVLTHKYPDESKALPILDTIKFYSEVENIDYTNPKDILIKTTSGNIFMADNVIFTASLGVLKTQHLSIFTPNLPARKQIAIDGFSIGAVNKIFLEFPHRWWAEDLGSFEFLWPEEQTKKFRETNPEADHWLLDVFGFFTVDFQPRVLCGWTTARGAREMENLPDSEVKDKIFELLQNFLGRKYNIPRPDNMLRSQWYSDKHFRGSYSYRSMNTEAMNVQSSDLSDPVCEGKDSDGKPTILFAGEATHEHYYSTVHGAIESGWREADRLIKYYR